jgi:hypothetical protein
MGIFGAPDVDWTITLDGGRLDVPAGSVVRAMVGFRARDAVEREVDVITSRRLRPDAHIIRSVAIVTG